MVGIGGFDAAGRPVYFSGLLFPGNPRHRCNCRAMGECFCPPNWVCAFQFVPLNWLYRFFAWVYQVLQSVIQLLTAILEGDGGILWSLVLLALLISLILTGGAQ
jgi:hypothetical protein